MYIYSVWGNLLIVFFIPSSPLPSSPPLFVPPLPFSHLPSPSSPLPLTSPSLPSSPLLISSLLPSSPLLSPHLPLLTSLLPSPTLSSPPLPSSSPLRSSPLSLLSSPPLPSLLSLPSLPSPPLSPLSPLCSWYSLPFLEYCEDSIAQLTSGVSRLAVGCRERSSWLQPERGRVKRTDQDARLKDRDRRQYLPELSVEHRHFPLTCTATSTSRRQSGMAAHFFAGLHVQCTCVYTVKSGY